MAYLITVLAFAFLQVVASDADRREAIQHYRTGQEHLAGERWERAAEEFGAAVRLDRLFTDAYFGLGQSYMGLQRYTSAIQAFERCVEAARELHGLRERDRVAGERQLDDQIKELRDTIRQMASQQGRDLRRLQAEQRLSDLERSRSSIGKPFEPPATVMLSLGSAHFRNGDREAAEKHWAEAVRLNAKLGEAWNNLAVIYLSSNRKAEAENAIKNAERAGFRVNPKLKDDVKAMK